MKVAHAQDNVRGSQGLGETKSFSISATNHAFKILSSGLYSDKIAAVLREIGCNAMDAHIEIGDRDRPFLVKLPNENDDQFFIQDWGPGLSHEDVMNLYSTYFASTKQTSNDFTGAFGLGSKSPFSYTDSISIVSAHGGKKRTYASYINNKGAPVTSLLTEEEADTSWPHGMRVGFSVRPGDYVAFQEKAQRVYQWFRVTPIIRGAPDVRKIHPTYIDGKLHVYSDVPGRHLLMGNVLYPLNLKELKIVDTGHSSDNSAAKVLANYVTNIDNFVLVVGIGDVEVAASREQLQYTEETTQFVRNCFEEISSKAAHRLVNEFRAFVTSNTWEARMQARKTMRSTIGSSWRARMLISAAEIVDQDELSDIHDFFSSNEIDFSEDAGAGPARVKLIKRRGGRSNKAYVQHVTSGRGQFGQTADLDVDKSAAIVVSRDDDVLRRACASVDANEYQQIVVVTARKRDKVSPAELTGEFDALQSYFGSLPVVELSDLPEVPERIRNDSKKRRGKNWVPTLPTREFTLVTTDDKRTRGTLDTVASKAFMYRRVKTAWGNVKTYYRKYDQPAAKDDSYFDSREWGRLWEAYTAVQESICKQVTDMPDTYALLDGLEVRESYVERLGWKPMHHVIKEQMERTDVRAALKSLRVQLGAPPAPTWVNPHSAGWMSVLSNMELHGGPIPQWLRDELQQVDVLDTVVDSAEAAKQKASSRGTKSEELLEHFNTLCNTLGVTSIRGEDIQEALTMDDLEARFKARFPLSACVNIDAAIKGGAVEVVKTVLSHEVKT